MLTFGDFALDFERRQLTRGGQEVRLSPKAYAFLCFLVERRPAAVSRKDLYDELWPDVYVSDANLATVVAEVRRALGDDARQPRYLRTVFGFGYAFLSDESERPDVTPFCRMIGDGIDLMLPAGETVLGRGMPQLAQHSDVSREHARVAITQDSATIEDLGSKNGTFVGGRRVQRATSIVDGDVILLGKTRLAFRRVADSGSTLTVNESAILGEK